MKTNTPVTQHHPVMSKMIFSFILLSASLLPCTAIAQHTHESNPDVTLHVNPELGMCDFDIASNLTQSEWKRSTRETGNILFLDPLSSPKSLGKWKWDLQLEQSSAAVDQESGAWNNTFHHPDSAHYLTGDNGRISVPALRFRMGITDRIDAGIYYTSAKPFGANYGFIGGELKCSVFREQPKGWAAAVRGSFVKDANIRDFNVFSAGADITAGKTFFGTLTPYAGCAVNWNHGRITSNEVNLSNENSIGGRGLAGIDFRWKFVNLGYEVQFGDRMKNRNLKIGVSF